MRQHTSHDSPEKSRRLSEVVRTFLRVRAHSLHFIVVPLLFASNHAAGKADPFGSHNDDVLALQELLRDGGGETAEHVALRVDDDDRFVRRLLFFCFMMRRRIKENTLGSAHCCKQERTKRSNKLGLLSFSFSRCKFQPATHFALSRTARHTVFQTVNACKTSTKCLPQLSYVLRSIITREQKTRARYI